MVVRRTAEWNWCSGSCRTTVPNATTLYQTLPVSNSRWERRLVPDHWSNYARREPSRPYLIDLAELVVVGEVVLSFIVHLGDLLALPDDNRFAFSERRSRSVKTSCEFGSVSEICNKPQWLPQKRPIDLSRSGQFVEAT